MRLDRDTEGRILLRLEFPADDYFAEQVTDTVNGTYTTFITMNEETAKKIWSAIGHEMVETALVRMRREPA